MKNYGKLQRQKGASAKVRIVPRVKQQPCQESTSAQLRVWRKMRVVFLKLSLESSTVTLELSSLLSNARSDVLISTKKA